jgi:hypothetical protein
MLGAVPHRYNQLRSGSCLVGFEQRYFHVPRHRTGDEEHVGVARRGHEVNAETLAVVHRACKAADFNLAPVTGTGIHFADGQGAPEMTPDLGTRLTS